MRGRMELIMAKITVDFNKPVGKMKPMHGVGQPPILGTSFSMFKYLTDAKIPYSRLHDVGGSYGGFRWVDIPNIFRDFDADENLPESYDFTFTDMLITALVEAGVEPIFRLGVTIENAASIKAYRIFPPKDPAKWARICEHVIRHYTEGWADGFKYKIDYWEIWNEPDNSDVLIENQMWRGTKEQYYELYDVASKHLKKCFPHLKIGGYGSCGFYAIADSFVSSAKSSPRMEYFIEFLDGFFDYIKENNCPLDFFSWHSYDTIKNNQQYAAYARRRLDEAGFTETETFCNEWNTEVKIGRTPHHAALCAGMLAALQNMPLDGAMFYDARCSVTTYAGLFDPINGDPTHAYHAFKEYNELYRLGTQCEIIYDEDPVYAVAATNENRAAMLIANTSKESVPVSFDIPGTVTKCLITSEDGIEKEVSLPEFLPMSSFLFIEVAL